MSTQRVLMTVCTLALVVALAAQAEAGWGRYRVTTYYGNPSVPVVRETVVVRGAHRPLLVAPAPVLVSPAPITAYYGAPTIIAPAPRGAVRATYYAPAPAAYYYAPAPATYYYQGYLPGTVILP